MAAVIQVQFGINKLSSIDLIHKDVKALQTLIDNDKKCIISLPAEISHKEIDDAIAYFEEQLSGKKLSLNLGQALKNSNLTLDINQKSLTSLENSMNSLRQSVDNLTQAINNLGGSGTALSPKAPASPPSGGGSGECR